MRATPRHAAIAAWLIVALPALWQLGLLAYAIAGRFGHPYDLEWMEGGMLVHADRIRAGQGLYVPPSVEFIPYLYTPLYPALIALVGTVVGISYQVGRALSILGVLLILACMAAAIVRDTKRADRGPALAGAGLAAGLFAATYPWVEGWYDVVRADTLFLGMVVGGLVLLRSAARRRSLPRLGAAAALLGLSFFCKQTGVLFVATGGALLLVWRPRWIPLYVAVTGVIGLGGTWLLQRATDGWFWTYVFEVHQVHDFNMDRFYASFGHIAKQFPAMTLLVAVALVAVLVTWAARRARPRSSAALLTWAPIFAVASLVGALGWGTQWAHFNAYMPAMATGALACGAAVPALAGVAAAWLGERRHAAALAHGLALVAAACIAVQLHAARWQPARFVPTASDRQAGDALIAHLRALRQDGDVYVPYHPWYARLAGQDATYVHRMGALDMTYGGRWRVAGLRDALQGGHFAAVVLDNRPVGPELAGLRQGYRLDHALPPDMAPRVVTGARVHPASVWLRATTPRRSPRRRRIRARSRAGRAAQRASWPRRAPGSLRTCDTVRSGRQPLAALLIHR